jgi:hypothetical protein
MKPILSAGITMEIYRNRNIAEYFYANTAAYISE